MSIGVAIVGGGIFAREEHLPAVLASPELSLKAVYSRSLKSAKTLTEEGRHVDLYSDDSGSGKSYKDLLARSDIHAVIIALPILKQPEFIKEALTAGKHVLSEKPVAENVADAKELIKFYHDKIGDKVTWGVAENFRYLEAFKYARSQIDQHLGKVTGFRVKVFGNVQPGGKWFETEWRKTPSHQGGFLLDGGVHFVAGTRLLLGKEAEPTTLCSYSGLLLEHLPPVDTINSIWMTKSGVSGTFSVSFGTNLPGGTEFTIGCEKGYVSVEGSKVTTVIDEKPTEKTFDEEGSGVKAEVLAWGKAISAGKPNPEQSPEQALADLEILEKCLRSGEAKGQTQTLEYQI